MTATWLDFCDRDPGPDWKVGYGTVRTRTLLEIEGVVDHSIEGTMAGGRAVLFGPRQASWTFSLPKVGKPVQHYPLEAICWHAGIAGDRKFDTSIIGNQTLVGKEHEGGGPDHMGEPWTGNQVRWSARIDVAMRAVCPQFAYNPPTLRLNEWEHNWLSATSCPSGRNPWDGKFALIREMEDDMDEATVKRLIEERLATHSGDPDRFQQILNNLPGLNQAQRDIIAQMIRQSGGAAQSHKHTGTVEVQ